jgi:hypothetical protein
MEDCIKDQGLTQQFERMANTHLREIGLLRLDWCKTKSLPKKQWLAENEIDVSRILLFLYGIFFYEPKVPNLVKYLK